MTSQVNLAPHLIVTKQGSEFLAVPQNKVRAKEDRFETSSTKEPKKANTICDSIQELALGGIL